MRHLGAGARLEILQMAKGKELAAAPHAQLFHAVNLANFAQLHQMIEDGTQDQRLKAGPHQDIRSRLAARLVGVVTAMRDADRMIAISDHKFVKIGPESQFLVRTGAVRCYFHRGERCIVYRDAAREERPGAEDLPASGGLGMPLTRIGRVSFSIGQTAVTLGVYWFEDYAGGIFIPFRDATSGQETYGAGRYLWDSAKGADLGVAGNRLVLDFNYAYHPSCVYDRRWNCPLAPAENRLPIAIRAGERL